MKRLCLGLSLLTLLAVPASAQQGQFNPRAGTTATVVTGGTPVTVLPAGVSGCYITNPLSATDQGIMTAEDAYINPTGVATTTGNGTNSTVRPGQTWYCIPYSNVAVSANAATSGHKLTVVRW